MIRMLLLACVLVAGCDLLPFPTPTAAVVPTWSCPPPAPIGGPWLDCDESVQMALGLLNRDHPAVAEIVFVYGPCPCPAGAACDCAIHSIGTVTIRFGDGGADEVEFSFVQDAKGHPIREQL